MKNIKRMLTTFIFAFSIIILVACSKGSSKTYVINENGNEATVKIEHKDNVVKKIDIVSKISYSAMDIENEEQAKLMLSMVSSTVTNMTGVKIDAKYSEKEANINVNVDFDKLDFEKIKKVVATFGEVPKDFDEKVSQIKEFKFLESKLLEAKFTEKK